MSSRQSSCFNAARMEIQRRKSFMPLYQMSAQSLCMMAIYMYLLRIVKSLLS
jgi:hypothetical protein